MDNLFCGLSLPNKGISLECGEYNGKKKPIMVIKGSDGIEIPIATFVSDECVTYFRDFCREFFMASDKRLI